MAEALRTNVVWNGRCWLEWVNLAQNFRKECISFCHNSRVWQTDRLTNRRTVGLFIERPPLLSCSAVKYAWDNSVFQLFPYRIILMRSDVCRTFCRIIHTIWQTVSEAGAIADLGSVDRGTAAHQKLGCSRAKVKIFHLAISPTSPLLFAGAKVRNSAPIFDLTHLWAVLGSKRNEISENRNKNKFVSDDDCRTFYPNFYSWAHEPLRYSRRFKPPWNRTRKICWIINNSAAHCPIMLQYDRLVGLWSPCNRENPFPVKSNMADSTQVEYIDIAVTPARSDRFRANLVQSLVTSQSIHYNRSRSKGRRSKSQCNVRYQR